MKKILVLNLTRLGDLIQSTPMLKRLKEKHRDSHVTLLVNKTFSGISEYIPFTDEVKIFDIKKFEPALLGEEISIVEVYRYVESLLNDLIENKFDMVINLTHSKLSAMISHFIGAKEIIGFASTDYGDRQIKGLWINYFYNMVRNRTFSRFNLVDIYTKSIGCNPNGRKLYITEKEELKTHLETFISRYNISNDDFIVGFQPGSSRTDRRWPSKSFAKLANMLNEKLGAKVVLFGTSAEEDVGVEIEKDTNFKLINLMGKTNMPELIGTIKRLNILVTNDTGTMHIAAVLRVKTLALFFAHALCFETGPYGENHIIIQTNISCSPCSHQVECKNMVCKTHIKTDDLFEVIKHTKSNYKNLDNLIKNDKVHFKNVSVMKPVFDKDEMIDFFPMNNRNITDRDLIGLVFKEVWKMILDNNPDVDTLIKNLDDQVIRISDYVLKTIKKHFLTDNIGELFHQINEDILSFEKIYELSKNGIKTSNRLLLEFSKQVKNIPLIQTLGNTLSTIDKQIDDIGSISEPTRSLVQVFIFGKENLEGEDLALLTKETIIQYKRLLINSYLMNRSLTKIKDEY